MVGPGDVDDDLEGETKEECQKYGEVNKCVIFEVSKKKKTFKCFESLMEILIVWKK